MDAMRLDRDFNSNTFPSNVISSSAEVLVEGNNCQDVLVAEKNLLSNFETG